MNDEEFADAKWLQRSGFHKRKAIVDSDPLAGGLLIIDKPFEFYRRINAKITVIVRFFLDESTLVLAMFDEQQILFDNPSKKEVTALVEALTR